MEAPQLTEASSRRTPRPQAAWGSDAEVQDSGGRGLRLLPRPALFRAWIPFVTAAWGAKPDGAADGSGRTPLLCRDPRDMARGHLPRVLIHSRARGTPAGVPEPWDRPGGLSLTNYPSPSPSSSAVTLTGPVPGAPALLQGRRIGHDAAAPASPGQACRVRVLRSGPRSRAGLQEARRLHAGKDLPPGRRQQGAGHPLPGRGGRGDRAALGQEKGGPRGRAGAQSSSFLHNSDGSRW